MDVFRRELARFGAVLASEGVLDQADDLYYLFLEELEELAALDARPRTDWKPLVAERREAARRETLRRQVPHLLLSDGRAFYEGGSERGQPDAATLVMETGGMMTHGAVVAREYGIPAVVGIEGAASRLATGQRVRVNGSTGRVTILG